MKNLDINTLSYSKDFYQSNQNNYDPNSTKISTVPVSIESSNRASCKRVFSTTKICIKVHKVKLNPQKAKQASRIINSGTSEQIKSKGFTQMIVMNKQVIADVKFSENEQDEILDLFNKNLDSSTKKYNSPIHKQNTKSIECP